MGITAEQLETIVATHGLKIDEWRCGAGKFRDLSIGTGAPFKQLNALALELKKIPGVTTSDGATSPALIMHFDRVTNDEHPDFGKLYLEIESFWWEENS